MPKQALIDYAHWFHRITDKRMLELEAAVRATPGFGSWTASFEPESLESLGEWFAEAVGTRPRTPEEVTEVSLRGNLLQSSASEVDLTNHTFSLAIDIGMYFARTFERSYPQLTWTQFLDDKKYVDYGQPVLTGFGPVPLNPVRIAVTLAYGITSGRQTGKRLREIYDYWSKQVRSHKH